MCAAQKRQKEATPAKRLVWQTVCVPKIVRCEAREFLSIGQYVHATDFVKQLVGFGSQQYDFTLSIEPIGEYWELKMKGGMLGRINLRIYFAYEEKTNKVAVLCAYKKEDDGKAPPHILKRIKNRLRLFREGAFDEGMIFYRHPKARSH